MSLQMLRDILRPVHKGHLNKYAKGDIKQTGARGARLAFSTQTRERGAVRMHVTFSWLRNDSVAFLCLLVPLVRVIADQTLAWAFQGLKPSMRGHACVYAGLLMGRLCTRGKTNIN